MWTLSHIMHSAPLKKAYEWQKTMPPWLRSAYVATFTSANQFADWLSEGYNFWAEGGKDGQALISAEPIAVDTYEGHLFCLKGTNPSLVTAVILFTKNWLWDNTDCKRQLIAVRTKHSGLRRIVINAGFVPTGYKIWDSAAEDGKVFEAHLMAAYKEQV